MVEEHLGSVRSNDSIGRIAGMRRHPCPWCVPLEEETMRIGVGNDHVALVYKEEISRHLREQGHDIVDYGTDSPEPTDYALWGERVAEAVASGEVERGIVICGTGEGIGIAANKVPGIRCCICSEPFSARLSRQHNDANMLAFGARVVGIEVAKMIVDEWMSAEFLGGRHQRRIDLISHIEQKTRASR